MCSLFYSIYSEVNHSVVGELDRNVSIIFSKIQLLLFGEQLLVHLINHTYQATVALSLKKTHNHSGENDDFPVFNIKTIINKSLILAFDYFLIFKIKTIINTN